MHAYVSFIRSESMSYPACTLSYGGRQCNKKLQNQGGQDDETWWCERCQQNSAVEWRYILSAQVSDHTGQQWITAFQVRCRAAWRGGRCCQLHSCEKLERVMAMCSHCAAGRAAWWS